MKNIIVIGGVLVALGALAFFFGSRQATAPTADNNDIVVEETNTQTDVSADESGLEAPAPEEEVAPGPVGGGTSGAQTSTPKPVTQKPAPAAYGALITWTDQGFKPNRVTILKGQTVRFVNAADEHDMWVASAIHPTHTAYQQKSTKDCLGSSFDQCEATGKGTYWDFKFDVPGTWDFHNHVRANETGEITVIVPE